MALIDKTIIARNEQHLVLAEHATVNFCDGSTLAVHRVDTASGLTTPWLRAVREGDFFWVFDCLQLVPDFVEHFKQAPERDNTGVVLYGLRFSYPTASILMQSARMYSLADIEAIQPLTTPQEQAA